MLTIVMYHYVRDVAETPYPGIKARSVAEFKGQLDHLEHEYEFVGCAEVTAAYHESAALPENAVLLTFDDGLVDHRDVVLPELLRRGIQGCFCPPAQAIVERRVLDVHKTQFILAASSDHAALAHRLLDLVRKDVPPEAELRTQFARATRFDPAETVFVKRLLQDGLPEEPRRIALDRLFAELVSEDEAGFADQLYISLDDVRGLAEAGMDVAGHGYEHRRLGLLEEAGQTEEIERTKTFLATVIEVEPERWTLCYAYGSRNETTLRLLAQADCALAFTVDPAVATLESSPLELPRLDTNDLPLC